MPKLIVSLPNSADITHELTENVITIGREPDNTLQIDDPSVSGYHARISSVGTRFELKDLGSTNGTRVNGDSFDKWELTNGDKIRFGNIFVNYVDEVKGATLPMPEAATASLKPAESSHRPSNFSNASPFNTKKIKKDPLNLVVRAVMILAFLAFIASVACIFLIQPPQ